jgi:NADH:ubiquinone oxidoreductase subunit 5 (subunit L)/multisubunit Na+/H+ antiporter MnhA subunit
MFVGLGAGAFTGGLFHLFNHAFFKAMLFLCSGAVIHGVHGEQDMRNMGGLRKSMPITAACFLIGTISISGFPGFSGFFSKDTIISGAWNFDRNLAWLMILTAGMTAFYMFRAYFMTFHGTYRGTAHPHEAPPSMWAPLVVLAVPSVLSGYLGVNPAAWLTEGGKILSGQVGSPFHNAFSSFVYFGHPEAESINGLVLLLSVGLAFTGFFCAVAVYLSHSWNINTVIVKNMPALYRFSLNKWYFDELYMAILKGLLAAFNAVWTAVDTLFVDRIVNGTASVTQKTGGVLRYTQNGSGQYYALMIFGWVAVLTIAAYFLRP